MSQLPISSNLFAITNHTLTLNEKTQAPHPVDGNYEVSSRVPVASSLDRFNLVSRSKRSSNQNLDQINTRNGIYTLLKYPSDMTASDKPKIHAEIKNAVDAIFNKDSEGLKKAFDALHRWGVDLNGIKNLSGETLTDALWDSLHAIRDGSITNSDSSSGRFIMPYKKGDSTTPMQEMYQLLVVNERIIGKRWKTLTDFFIEMKQKFPLSAQEQNTIRDYKFRPTSGVLQSSILQNRGGNGDRIHVLNKLLVWAVLSCDPEIAKSAIDELKKLGFTEFNKITAPNGDDLEDLYDKVIQEYRDAGRTKWFAPKCDKRSALCGSRSYALNEILMHVMASSESANSANGNSFTLQDRSTVGTTSRPSN